MLSWVIYGWLDFRFLNIFSLSQLTFRRWIFNTAQRSYTVGIQRWKNVEATLYNFISTLFQCGLNFSNS